MSLIRFGELPPRESVIPKKGKRGFYDYVVWELSARPGEWAEVQKFSNSNSLYVTKHRLRRKYPQCEIENRGTTIWMRVRDEQ